jgi:hypothetical protein
MLAYKKKCYLSTQVSFFLPHTVNFGKSVVLSKLLWRLLHGYTHGTFLPLNLATRSSLFLVDCPQHLSSSLCGNWTKVFTLFSLLLLLPRADMGVARQFPARNSVIYNPYPKILNPDPI